MRLSFYPWRFLGEMFVLLIGVGSFRQVQQVYGLLQSAALDPVFLAEAADDAGQAGPPVSGDAHSDAEPRVKLARSCCWSSLSSSCSPTTTDSAIVNT